MPRLMSRLGGLFSRTRSTSNSSATKRGVRPDSTILNDHNAPSSATESVDQAARLRKAVSTDTPDGNVDADTHTTTKIPQAEVVTRRDAGRDLLPSRRRDRREMQANQYEQVVGLIERIGKHLDTQAERSDRMVTLLERLPDALDSLPDIKQNSEQLTSVLEQHFKSQREREEQLRGTIEELGVGSTKQAEALSLIRDEIHAGGEREIQMTEVMGDFRTTLGTIGETNERSVEVLKELAIRSRDQEGRFAHLLERQNRTLMIVAGAAVVSSIAGLVVAIIALVKIAGM